MPERQYLRLFRSTGWPGIKWFGFEISYYIVYRKQKFLFLFFLLFFISFLAWNLWGQQYAPLY